MPLRVSNPGLEVWDFRFTVQTCLIFDESIDGPIESLGNKLQYTHGSRHQVPSIEFRELNDIPASRFESWMTKAN